MAQGQKGRSDAADGSQWESPQSPHRGPARSGFRQGTGHTSLANK